MKCFYAINFLMMLLFYQTNGSKNSIAEYQSQMGAKGNEEVTNFGENFSSEREPIFQGKQRLLNQPLEKRAYEDLNNLNNFFGDLQNNKEVPTETDETGTKGTLDYEFENVSPVTYYLLLQKIKQLQTGIPTFRVRTPRLGRSISAAKMLQDSDQFVSPLIKKSVQFKPRLGKRTETLCDILKCGPL